MKVDASNYGRVLAGPLRARVLASHQDRIAELQKGAQVSNLSELNE